MGALAETLGLDRLMGANASDAAKLTHVDEDRKVRLGMFLYVMSDAILAVFFFGTYIFLRGYNTNLRWVPPPVAHRIGGGPVANTAWIMGIALAGACCYALGMWTHRHGMHRLFLSSMALAFGFYVVDLAGQVWLMGRFNFTVGDGTFADSFILLSGYHVYHMALASFLGFGMVNRAFRGLYKRSAEVGTPNAHSAAWEGRDEPRHSAPHWHTGLSAIGYFWYYAAAYAVAVWLLLLVQPPLPLGK